MFMIEHTSILRGVFIDMFNYRGVGVKIHRGKNPCTSPVSWNNTRSKITV
jgi:hypothetical protein